MGRGGAARGERNNRYPIEPQNYVGIERQKSTEIRNISETYGTLSGMRARKIWSPGTSVASSQSSSTSKCSTCTSGYSSNSNISRRGTCKSGSDAPKSRSYRRIKDGVKKSVPAAIVLWVFHKIPSRNGLTSRRVISFVKKHCRMDDPRKNPGKSIGSMLRCAVDFGLLEKRGNRYYLIQKKNR